MIRIIPARILAAAVLLIAALTGLILREERLRQSGREVMLSIQAVDPRDLLTGHYAAIAVQQSFAPGAPCPPGAARQPDVPTLFAPGPRRPAQWVALSPAGDHYVPSGMAVAEAAARRRGPILVRGALSCVDGGGTLPTVASLDIGVKRFHTDQKDAEAMAAALQQWQNPPPAYAIVSIGADGKARLKGVQIAGKRSMLSWF
jgi:hypothetical protein